MRGRGSFLCSSQVAAGPDRAGGTARGEQGAAPRPAATAPGAAPSRRPGGAACGPAPPGGAGPAGCTRPPGASRRCPGAEALGRPLPASSPPPARARGRRCLRLIAAARRLPPLCREGRGRRDPAGDMGNGMCSRKQKRIFQTLVLLTVVFSFIYGAMLYYELQSQLRKAEATALKYQQHQESLSAQLQVVYEHRSRLEKSLQKERLEHKKAKEDFLVYKLEAQETLNKGRQDSNSRYSALSVQHQMLKSQHEELKKQHANLEEDHRKQGEEFSRTFSDHKQRY